MTRETAARFSFLLSIPAIAASGCSSCSEAFDLARRHRAREPRRGDSRLGRRRLRQHRLSARLPAPPLDLPFIGYRLIVGAIVLGVAFYRL